MIYLNRYLTALVAVVAICIALFVAVEPASAHPGGLNASGCHNNRRTGDYHCHRGSAPSRPAPVERVPLVISPTYYRSCAEARAAGVAPLRRGDAGYRPGLDGDGDGIACEYAGTSAAEVGPSGGVAAAPGAVSVIGAPGGAQAPIIGVAVATDGDTLVINSQRIRLYGVDAFEAEQRCTGTGGNSWGCGGVATRAMQELVSEGQTICWPKDRDAYGRIVAVCRNGGVDLSAAIVVRGLAVAYSKYSTDYETEQVLAKDMRAGAWGASFTNPEDYRRSSGGRSAAIAARTSAEAGECVIKGNISARGRKLFFRPGDNNYDRVKAEAMFCGEAEALAAGFEHAEN